MLSYGDWYYQGNSTSTRNDQNGNLIAGGTPTILYIDKIKVGNTAQQTAAIGMSYVAIKNVTLDANYNYYAKLFGNIDPTKFSTANNKGALELPSYGLVDAGLSYKMLVGKDKANSVNFRLNVNNVFDKIYIAESKTNIFADDVKTAAVGTTPAVTYEQAGALYQGVATANQVFFGYGRTWNFTLRYNF